MKRRTANAILIALAGVAGSVIAWSVPMPMLEFAVARSGISDIVPVAELPLGETARALFVVAGGLCVAALVAVALVLGRGNRMSFAFLKWNGLRGGKAVKAIEATGFEPVDAVEEILPVQRRADAHPDAPPRPPLSASRELGDEALPPAGSYDADEDDAHEPAIQDAVALDMPRAPEPLPWETIQREMERLIAGVEERDEGEAEAPANRQDADVVSTPSIRELADRLETGLARRRAATGGQLPVRPDLANTIRQEVVRMDSTLLDEPSERSTADLDDALAALRRITAKAI